MLSVQPSVSTEVALLLCGLMAVAACLYSSVGHAGASAYLALMSLCGVDPAVMRPTALVLNVMVAAVGTRRFHVAGQVDWSLLSRLALGSVPAAFLGGWLSLPRGTYLLLLSILLGLSGVRLLVSMARDLQYQPQRPSGSEAFLTGASIGFVAGLVGIGGGVFLSPWLLFARWATTRCASGITAAFILVNSVAGLAGRVTQARELPAELGLWVPAVVLGGWIGSWLGAQRLPELWVRRLLGAVVLTAALKLLRDVLA
jgi:uncharacterized membrane protein YfcA